MYDEGLACDEIFAGRALGVGTVLNHDIERAWVGRETDVEELLVVEGLVEVEGCVNKSIQCKVEGIHRGFSAKSKCLEIIREEEVSAYSAENQLANGPAETGSGDVHFVIEG